MSNTLAIIAALTLLGAPAAAQDWNAVDAAMGRAGVVQPGNVHRYNFPRSDLRVTVAGIRVKPALALGGWIAMKAAGDGVVAMGDLVLAEAEIEPVMLRLQRGGVEQTALHHHLLHESPRVTYMHVHARGDPVKIAETIRAALALTRAPPASSPSRQPAATARVGLDTAAISGALGHPGNVNGGVYQIAVPRADTIREDTFEIPPSMGVATAINFQPVPGRPGRAAITGDFVLLAGEVNPVIRALRYGGIEVTSVHNHMLDEQPRLFFVHFWANDDALKLARGLRAALERTNSTR